MELNDTVYSPYGKGEIVDIESHFGKRRYGLKLENNPFSYPVAYFWFSEVSTVPVKRETPIFLAKQAS